MQNIKKQLKNLAEKASGKVKFEDLFNEEFMKLNTEFKTIDGLFQYCKLDIKTQKDYDNIKEDVLDKAVKEKTKFRNWNEMLEKAGKEQVIKKLNELGIKTK